MWIRLSPEVAAQLQRAKVADQYAAGRPLVQELAQAYATYRTRLEELAAIRPCLETWPGDPAGPDYVGTRCQLLEGHAQQRGTRHRHRMLGSSVTVEWD